MTTYTITRDVEEWIVVEADDEDAAQIAANESPLDDWNRDVKDERVEDGDLSGMNVLAKSMDDYLKEVQT